MGQSTKKNSILIIDDAPENIDVLIELFKSEYMVSAARSGEKGLKLAKKNLPDLVLLDIIMPGMDGYEVCKVLKSDEATKDIPVIFITSVSEFMDEAKTFNLGGVDFITKPFNPITVKARIKTHINLKMKSDMLEQLASIDGLTNIHNRRKFDEMLAYEWKRSKRNNTPISLILIDVDYFKKFNDNYGHANGDECLKQIAGCLKDSLARAGDFLARYGGEEFVVILPGADMTRAKKVAENLRNAVFSLNIPHQFSKTAKNVTISSGVATAIPLPEKESPQHYSPIDLTEAADKMLYRSKETGRNKVTASELEYEGEKE